MAQQLYRTQKNRVIAGVCSGMGEYFDMDPILFRLLFILLALAHGIGIVGYLVFWLVVPEKEAEASVAEEISSHIRESLEGEKGEEKSKEKGKPEHPFRQPHRHGYGFGLILILLGSFFLLDEFLPGFDIGRLWPLIAIGIGISMMANAASNR